MATASVVGLLLGSCSTVPDELNPVAWYESVEDLVAGDGDEEASDQIVITDADQQPVPGADEPFPNLSSVPGDAPRTMPADERRAVASALVADRQHARYTDEAVRRDTSDSPAATPMAAQSDFSQDFAPQDFGGGSPAAASPAPRVEREVADAPAAGIPDMARTETEMPRPPAPPTSWEGDPYAQYRERIGGDTSAPAAMTTPAPAPVTASPPPPPAVPRMADVPEEPAETMTVAREFGDSEDLPWQEESADAARAGTDEQAMPAASAPRAVAAVPAPAPAAAPQPRDNVSDAYAAYESVRTAARDSDRTPYQGAPASDTSSAYETYAAASRSERPTPAPAPETAPAPSAASPYPSAPAAPAPVAVPYPNAPAAAAPARRESYEGVFSKYFQESGQPPAQQPSFPYQTSAYRADPYGANGQGEAGSQPAHGASTDPVGVITFESSSSRLSGNDLDVVRRIADAHQSYGGTVRVVGHASSRTLVNDPSRHRQENLRISLKRAQAVARALREDGVPENAIVVAAMSDAEPLYSEATPLGEAANRRAEIFFDYGARSR